MKNKHDWFELYGCSKSAHPDADLFSSEALTIVRYFNTYLNDIYINGFERIRLELFDHRDTITKAEKPLFAYPACSVTMHHDFNAHSDIA